MQSEETGKVLVVTEQSLDEEDIVILMSVAEQVEMLVKEEVE